MTDSLYTIDVLKNIIVDRNKFNNEINAISQLLNGMISLYNTVKPLEVEIAIKNVGKKFIYWGVPGNDDLIPQNISILLPCIFHWYGNSLYNYARLAGFIVGRELGCITDYDIEMEPQRKKIKNFCDSYVKEIKDLQEIVKWRNKVSAHFALTDPRNDDNIATMNSSIIFPIIIENNKFRTAGKMIMSLGDANNTYDSEIPDWSLTESFELLAPRFWPEIKFK